MLKITEDRAALNKAVKRLDRSLNKLSSNNELVRVRQYGDSVSIDIVRYQLAAARDMTHNNYTNKRCRCDEYGVISYSILPVSTVLWSARLVGRYGSPFPLFTVNMSPECSLGGTYDVGTSGYINSTSDLTGTLADNIFFRFAPDDSSVWCFRTAEGNETLVAMVRKKQTTGRLLEYLSNSFGIPKRVGVPLMLECRSIATESM